MVLNDLSARILTHWIGVRVRFIFGAQEDMYKIGW